MKGLIPLGLRLLDYCMRDWLNFHGHIDDVEYAFDASECFLNLHKLLCHAANATAYKRGKHHKVEQFTHAHFSGLNEA